MTYSGKAVFFAALISAGVLSNASAALYDGNGPGESTIGTGGDYASLYDACEAISAASLTGGDWDFLILNDLDESLNSSITQTESSSHTITLRPAPGVDATVTFTTTYPQPPIRTVGHLTVGAKTVYVNSQTTLTYIQTHNITIDGSNTPGDTTQNLTFKNLAGDGARTLIGVMGHCDNITVKNCKLDSYGTYGTGSGAPYSLPVAGVDFVQRDLGLGMNAPLAEVQNGGLVQNCEMRKLGNFAAIGVSLNCRGVQTPYFPNRASDSFTVSDNTITSFSLGIRTMGAQTLVIADNTIRPGPGGPYAIGMHLQPAVAIGSVSYVSGNTITFPKLIQSARLSGIHTRELNSQSETFLDNNVIAGDFSRGTAYTFAPYAYGVLSEVEADSTVTLRHNSIAMHGTNIVPNLTAGFHLGGFEAIPLASYGKAILRNNIVRVGLPMTVAIRTEGTSATIDSDYNDLFAIPGSYIGRCEQFPRHEPNPETLSWWQAVSGQDTHSSNIDPYVPAGTGLGTWIGPADSDLANLHFTAYPGPDYLAPALAEVPADIDGDSRSGELAVMGADTMAIPATRVDEWGLY